MATLLIVITFSVASFIVGQFLTPVEQVTSTSSTTITDVQIITTTSVWTRTTTLTWKITETSTTTSTVVKEPPSTIPPPANSTAIIRSHLIFNGTVFVMFSIDKPVYSIGELVHIKTIITNLTPKNMSFIFEAPVIKVLNSTEQAVWTYPEGVYGSGFGPATVSRLNLLSGETKIIEEYMSSDWNMTGLHMITTKVSGGSHSELYYNDHFVPEGQYTIVWPTGIIYYEEDVERTTVEYINEIISFTITKQD